LPVSVDKTTLPELTVVAFQDESRVGVAMRIERRFLPDALYCWIFEHDDFFVHDDEPTTQQYWCQRCFTWLPTERRRAPWPS
jgi:hypothetical protein